MVIVPRGSHSSRYEPRNIKNLGYLHGRGSGGHVKGMGETLIEVDKRILRIQVTSPPPEDGESLRNKFVTSSDEKRRWTEGEDIVAVANDVPVAGYKTTTTIPHANFDSTAFK
ncbi:hypothetical protein Tco_1383003, partial [Tanacetum coccineum]